MSRTKTYIILTIFVVAVAAYMVSCLRISTQKNSALTCTGVNITIQDSLQCRFVTREEILQNINKNYGACTGTPAWEIDLTKIEQIINQSSAVRSCEAYITPDGKLNIEICQRTPVIKFLREEGGLYADEGGFLFPIQGDDNHNAVPVRGRAPISAGNNYKGILKDPDESEWLENMIVLADYLKKSPLWEDGATYISAQANGNVVIASDNLSVRFIIGEPKNIESKFLKIGEYYSAIVPEKGEDYYRTVNVEYAGQIVCK